MRNASNAILVDTNILVYTHDRGDEIKHTQALAHVTPAIVIEGCRGVVEHQLAFWDSLIWAAAKLNQVPYVLTEDAHQGRVLESVEFHNPFDAAFDPLAIGLVARP